MENEATDAGLVGTQTPGFVDIVDLEEDDTPPEVLVTDGDTVMTGHG